MWLYFLKHMNQNNQKSCSQLCDEAVFKAVFDSIRALMQPPKSEKHPIGFTADIKNKETRK